LLFSLFPTPLTGHHEPTGAENEPDGAKKEPSGILLFFISVDIITHDERHYSQSKQTTFTPPPPERQPLICQQIEQKHTHISFPHSLGNKPDFRVCGYTGFLYLSQEGEKR
jgi:hypothetical protein